MGTIQIKKVKKTVTTGKQGEVRQKVKKTYGKIIYRGTLSLTDHREGHRHQERCEQRSDR